MTFPQLAHFQESEFPHSEKMNTPFLRWLDRVRDRAGVPMTITDAGREDGDPEPSGSAGAKSLHHRGTAVDFRTRDLNAQQKWRIMAAIVEMSKETPDDWKVEFEPVFKLDGDHHWHVGLDWTPGKGNEMVESDD